MRQTSEIASHNIKRNHARLELGEEVLLEVFAKT
jgi:hypothetical protein